MELGDKVFLNCEKLKHFDLPSDIVKMGHNVFQGCKAIKSILIPEDLAWKKLSDCEFFGCESLDSLTIPQQITKVGNSTFEGCSSLKKIILPSTITDIIWANTFMNCTSLETVVLPKSLNDWTGAEGFFGNCKSLKAVYSYDPTPVEFFFAYKNTILYGANPEATLYVPKGCVDIYRSLDGWNKFKYIKEFDAGVEGDPTGIQQSAVEKGTIEKCYDLNGVQISKPMKGLNVVKTSDGQTKKVLVK